MGKADGVFNQIMEGWADGINGGKGLNDAVRGLWVHVVTEEGAG